MKHYQAGNYHLYESNDFDSERDYDDLAQHLDALTGCFLRRPLIRELVQQWGRKHHRQNIIRLMAHGEAIQREWFFFDREKQYCVQDWINQHEKNAAALLLECCNPSNNEITSNHAIVVHPQSSVNRIEIIRRRESHRMRVYIPQYGYVENSYALLHRALKSLSSRITSI